MLINYDIITTRNEYISKFQNLYNIFCWISLSLIIIKFIVARLKNIKIKKIFV